MSLTAHLPSAHLLDVRDLEELRRELQSVGVPDAEATAGRLERLVVRLTGLTPEAAARVREAAALTRPAGLPGSGVEVHGQGQGPALLAAGPRGALQRLAAELAAQVPELGAGLERCLASGPAVLRWGRRSLDFRFRAQVMGILNCTPDSFYPGSRLAGPDAALAAARAMIAAGADILDVGGESTRPGSEPVTAAQELARVIPVIAGIRRESDILLSIDTRKPEVAGEALAAGADLVNDVSAARSPGMASLVARQGVPIVLMHMRGEPKTMQVEPHFEEVVGEVLGELAASLAAATAAGVRRELIIVDPGIGFGKRLADNLCLLRHLRSLRSLGCPVLIGLSRKSFLGTVTGAEVETRLPATIAADTLAVLHGADILRVHDVPEAVQTVRLVEAVRGTQCR